MFYHYAPIEGNKERLVELDRRRLLAVDHDEDLNSSGSSLAHFGEATKTGMRSWTK
jgi:hypothetical protein